MDRIIRCITTNGAIMATAVDSTFVTATAQEIHKTSPVATAALGRLLTGASIMGAMLKKESASITLKIQGGGPVGTLTAIADSQGNVKGWVEHPEVTLPLRADGKLDVGGAVGKNGFLGVIRDFGDGTPYTGQVELCSGEIAEDLTQYYAQSEQIPTLCALGVLVDKTNHAHVLSGGMLVQVLPGALEEDIAQLEKNAAQFPPVTTMLAQGMSIEDMCRRVLCGFEMEVLDETPVRYACGCSKERVERALSLLQPEEIRTLSDETGWTEAGCQYCGKVYRFSKGEMEELARGREKKI